MAVDYLKTYLGIDPNDYSSMEARIRGDEPQAQVPLMRQPTMMPQTRSLGEMEAMPMAPRSQPTPQVDDRYQSLMDEIASLKAQIEGMQAPTEQVATDQAPVMADTPTEVNMEDARKMFYQSPEFKDYQERTKNIGHTMEYNPSNYTDPTTGSTVSFQDRSGLFQDWYKNTYGRDLTVENRFSGSLDPSLGGVLDESKRIQAPTKSINDDRGIYDPVKQGIIKAPLEIQNRMIGEPQKLPPVPPRRVIHRGPTGSVEIYDDNMGLAGPDMSDKLIKRTTQAPSQDIQASIDYLSKLPKMNIPQIPDIEQIRQKMEEANMTFPEPVSYQDQLQSIRDLPPMPNNFMGDSARNVMSQIQQPQMQSFGRPQLPFQGGFMPEMRAGGGGIDKAIYDLKFKLNG